MTTQLASLPLLNGNTVWLTITESPTPIILRGQLLGLNPDHSMWCSLPGPFNPADLTPGLGCMGQTLIDGETYQFEATIRSVQLNPPTIHINCPYKITQRAARVYPRLPVTISGTIRPLGQDQQILAVLPFTMTNLNPTGCQLQVGETNWPQGATLNVVLSCHLPSISHTSKFQGKIEWIDPTPELQMGVQFQFTTSSDVSQQDLIQWFQSQKATLINTVA
ncbi:MAG: PilZ domain-containing protein [Nitrospirae bacterium]|nr:PilZ domain-containing protein [Nitrospirota bacterium]